MNECYRCGENYDPMDSESNTLCPTCVVDDMATISDLGQSEKSHEHSVSVTGIHESVTGANQPAAQANWIGKIFGDYKIVDRLGKGGMGIVFSAIQQSTNRKVALKVIRDDRLEDIDTTIAREWVARFKSEAMAAAKLEHENIVTVYEFGQLDGNHYFSMQYVSGASLSKISKERNLTGRQIAGYMIPVCRALQHAHSRGILHRDIKPGNIMIDDQNRPFLTDFGLAKWFEDDDHSMTRSGQVVGTATYMSPQQATDASHATIACDVYSLGATLYRLLAGRPPFDKGSLVEVLRQVVDEEPTPPSQFRGPIDADIETIALKCLEKAPESRYASADELADDLERYLKGEPIHARPVSRRERVWRWCKRNPFVASLAGLAITLLITTVIVSTIGYVQVSLAYAENQKSLRASLLAQAIGMGSSTEAGRRGRALDALSRAAEIEPGLDLRNEYAGYLDQPDIEALHEIKIPGWDKNSYAEAIGDSETLIAVPSGGHPIRVNYESGTIVESFDEMGPFKTQRIYSGLLSKISEDGRFLAGNSGECVEIWNIETKKKIGTLGDSGNPIHLDSLVFDRNCQWVFCAGMSKDFSNVVLYLFELSSLNLVSKWTHPARSIDYVEFVDGDTLLAGMGVVNNATGQQATKMVTWSIPRSPGTPNQIAEALVSKELPYGHLPRSLAIDRAFSRAYLGEKTGFLLAFSLPSLNPIQRAFLGRHADSVNAIDVNQNSRWILSAGKDRRLKLWDQLSGNVVTQIDLDSQFTANMQWLPRGKLLLSDTRNGLRVWEFNPPISNRVLAKDQHRVPQTNVTPLGIEFGSNENALFYSVGDLFCQLDLAAIDDGFKLIQTQQHSCMFISPDGQRFGVYNVPPNETKNDKPIQLFDRNSNSGASEIDISSDGLVLNLAQLNTGEYVLSEYFDLSHLRLRQLGKSQPLFEQSIAKSGIDTGRPFPQIKVANKENRVAIRYVDEANNYRLQFVDLKTKETLLDVSTRFGEFDIDSAATRFAIIQDGELLVHEVEDDREVFRSKIGSANRISLSGDGSRAVTMDTSNGEIRVFDGSGQPKLILRQEEIMPVWLDVSHSGKWLAISDSNGVVRIWNLHQLTDELVSGGVMASQTGDP